MGVPETRPSTTVSAEKQSHFNGDAVGREVSLVVLYERPDSGYSNWRTVLEDEGVEFRCLTESAGPNWELVCSYPTFFLCSADLHQCDESTVAGLARICVNPCVFSLFLSDDPHELEAAGEFPIKFNLYTRRSLTRAEILSLIRTGLSLTTSRMKSNLCFDRAPYALFLTDPTGRYTDVNEAGLRMLDTARDQVIGKSVADVLPDCNRQKCAASFEHVGKHQSSGDDFRVMRGDDGSIDVALEAAALPDGTAIAYCKDVTEEVRLENALLEARHQIVLQTRIATAFLTRPDTSVYATVLEIVLEELRSEFGFFGYIDDNGDLISPSLTRGVWEKCEMAEKNIRFPRADWKGLWGRSLLEKRPLYSNENLHLPEGHVPLSGALAVPILYDDDLIGQIAVANAETPYTQKEVNVLEALAGQIAPVLHARLQTQSLEQERLKAEDALVRSEALLWSTGRMAKVGGWELQASDGTMNWTDEMYRIHEVPVNFTPTLKSYVDFAIPRMRPVLRKRLDDAVKHGTQWDFEFEIVTAKGAHKWLHTIAQPVWRNDYVVRVTGTLQDITERKKSEEALRRSRAALDSSADMLFLIDPYTLRFLDVNETAVASLGWSRHELLCMGPSDISPQGQSGKVAQIAKALLSGDAPETIHTFHNRKNKERFPVEVCLRLFESYGKKTIVAAARDITDRRAAQEALQRAHDDLERKVEERTNELSATNLRLRGEIEERARAERTVKESEKRFRSIFNSVFDSLIIVDARMCVLYVNEATVRLFGHSRKQIAGKSLEILCHVSDFPKLSEAAVRALEHGTAALKEVRFISADGTSVYLEAGASRFLSSYGDLVVLSLRDVTQRKEAEWAFFETQQHFIQLADNIQEIFFLVDIESESTLYYSPALCQLLAMEDPVIASGLPLTDCMHPEDCENSPLLDREVRFQKELDEEFRIIRHSGEIRWVRFRSFPVNDEHGIPFRVACVATDITEQKTAADREHRHQHQLIQADKMTSLGILVSGVAHEISNPNNLIMLNADVLARIWAEFFPILDEHAGRRENFVLGGLPYEEMKAELESLLIGIGEGSERIKRIVHSLKDFVRADAGGLDESVDLNTVIDSAIFIVGNLVKRSTSNFKVSRAENLPPVRGNAQQLEQVVINLITNACQALPNTHALVSVSTAYDGATVLLIVGDEGTGIPVEIMNLIMDPFFTTKRDSGGTGLGLAVSYGIIQAHGGTMSFDSAPGGPTTATVALPPME